MASKCDMSRINSIQVGKCLIITHLKQYKYWLNFWMFPNLDINN
jgi:hypothetical protein